MGGILLLYQAHGLYIICEPDTDVVEKSYRDCSWIARQNKNKKLSCYLYAFFLNWVPELASGVPVLPLSFISTAL